MNKLNQEEVKAHKEKIKHIRERSIRARTRFLDGDITMKKMRKIEREVRKEEADYIQSSGIILYFGQLFKGVSHGQNLA